MRPLCRLSAFSRRISTDGIQANNSSGGAAAASASRPASSPAAAATTPGRGNYGAVGHGTGRWTEEEDRAVMHLWQTTPSLTHQQRADIFNRQFPTRAPRTANGLRQHFYQLRRNINPGNSNEDEADDDESGEGDGGRGDQGDGEQGGGKHDDSK